MSVPSQPALPGAQPYPFSLITDDLVVERYQLEDPLTQNDDGIIWRAIDRALSRRVAIHLLKPHSSQTIRVLDAARNAAIATDSRFVRVLDAMGGEKPFIVYELATGMTLRAVLAEGPLSLLEAVFIVREAADALSPLHAEGLFHRHLSLDNVIITPSGSIKIMGLLIEEALAPQTTTAKDWVRQEADDIHALGKILYACMVAHWPIDSDQPQTSKYGLPAAPMDHPGPQGPRWMRPSAINPRVSPTLDAICLQIFDPRPESVPLHTADEIVTALDRVLGAVEADSQLEQRVHAMTERRRAKKTSAHTSSEALRPVDNSSVSAPIASASGPQNTSSDAQLLAHNDSLDSSIPRRGVDSSQLPDDAFEPIDDTTGSIEVSGRLSDPLQARLDSPFMHGPQRPQPHRVSQGIGSNFVKRLGQMRQSITRNPERLTKIARWGAPAFVVLMLIIAFTGLISSCQNREARAVTSLTPAATSSVAEPIETAPSPR